MTIVPNPSSSNVNGGDGNNSGGDHDFLNLSLSTSLSTDSNEVIISPPSTAPSTVTRKRQLERRSSTRLLGPGKTEIIAPPYPWATERRATTHSLQTLVSRGINSVSGSVQCKRCEKQFEVEYDLHAKYREVAAFIGKYREEMHHRAPAVWMNPTLPDCRFCEQRNCVKPVASKKKSINWLFLFLGQLVGCCKLSELKYFCKHTKKHRTGAKDRVLYLTYLEICCQLEPQANFDV